MPANLVLNASGGLANQIRMLGLPKPTLEYRFDRVRRWRFDLAWPDKKVAVEVDGGAWIQGRHSRGAGLEADCEKFAEAACLGWCVIRVTPHLVVTGQAVKWVERLLTLNNQ